MKILLHRSIPLSQETRDAWKNQEGFDVRFSRRDRSLQSSIEVASRNNYNLVVNLGSSEVTEQGLVPLINPPEVVGDLISPTSIRNSRLASILPPRPELGDEYWKKGQGRHDRNKQRLQNYQGEDDNNYDYQRHIDGDEYRVITVGPRVVQCMQRVPNPDDREYRWVGLQGTPNTVKNLARHAVSLLEDTNALIGWDIITGGAGCFVLEGNTCPGINDASAGRILAEIRRQYATEDTYDVEPNEQVNDDPFSTIVNAVCNETVSPGLASRVAAYMRNRWRVDEVFDPETARTLGLPGMDTTCQCDRCWSDLELRLRAFAITRGLAPNIVPRHTPR